MRSLLALLADALLGPRCPYGCDFRARGWRTLQAHEDFNHAGDDDCRGDAP